MSHTMRRPLGLLKKMSLVLLGVVALSAAAPQANAQGYCAAGQACYRGVSVGQGYHHHHQHHGYQGYASYGYSPRVYHRGYYGYRAPIVPYVGCAAGSCGGYALGY